MLKTMTWLPSSPLHVGMDRLAAGWPHASTLVLDVLPYWNQWGERLVRGMTVVHTRTSSGTLGAFLGQK